MNSFLLETLNMYIRIRYSKKVVFLIIMAKTEQSYV